LASSPMGCCLIETECWMSSESGLRSMSNPIGRLALEAMPVVVELLP
jgi:hypothetical protein